MYRLGLIAALVLIAEPLAGPAPAADPPVRVWQSTISLTTWEEGFPDPMPHFPVLAAARPWYPYPVRSELGRQSRKETWRTLNLENEFLICTVLPDLGGHLYSCRDKLSGYEMFHANPSVKKAMMGLRGAWAALGVELNFPVGHSLLTVSPVDFRLSQTASAANVSVGATDRVSGMRWRVEFTLESGSAVLRQAVRLENATAVRHRYYWWTNAEVTRGADTRFVLPTKLIAGHGRAQIDSWPIGSEGVDRSVPENFPNSAGWFAHETREPFLAVYNQRAKTGTLHYADPAELPGKKIWIWGRDEDAQMRAALSDNNSQYVEIQAGLFANQETYGFLDPGASRSFTEYWIPVRNLDGISQAGRDAVLYLPRKNGALEAEVLATRAIPGAKVQIDCGGKLLAEETAPLEPATVWTHSFVAAPAAPCRFRLQDGGSQTLLEYNEGEIRAAGAESVKLGPQPSSLPVAATAEGAEYFEAQGDLGRAADELRKLLAKTPADLGLRKSAGRLATVMQRYDEAAALLAAAADGESHYYRGVALAGMGADDDARREWLAASDDRQFGSLAALETAAAMARAGDWEGAASAVNASGAQSVRALSMQSAMARTTANPAAAKEAIARAAAMDATDSAVRFEQVRQGAADPQLWDHLGADPERVLEIADLYVHWGLYKDALEVLMHRYAPVSGTRREPGAVSPEDYAMLAYYRGYCHQKLNQPFADDYRTASSLPVKYVFPSRPAERPLLEAVLQTNAGDANAHYLLGLWHLNTRRVAEATRELQAAQKLRPEFAEAKALLAALKAPMATAPPAAPTTAPAPASAPPKVTEAPRPSPSPSNDASPLSSVPGWMTAKPLDAVNSALEAAAAGQGSRALTYFTSANFPESNQPELVRWSHLEASLQRLFELAYAGKCAEVTPGLGTLGDEDKHLAFTARGAGDLMKGARFQFQIALLEIACVDEKTARRRWERVAKMRAPQSSPDFAYPYLAAAKLGKTSSLPGVVQQIDRAMATAAPADQPVLLYSRGLLLWAQDQKDAAGAAFRQGAAAAPPGVLRYLNQNAVHVLTR